MIKKIALIALLGFIMISCGQVKEQQNDVTETQQISELVSQPLEYEDQEVSFEGVITHICQHSGDKMRVNQSDDADFSILVMLEEFQPQFSAEMEGKLVKINGVMKTVVSNMDEIDHSHDHAHDGEEEHECSSTEEAIELMAERGITPDITSYVELKGFEVIQEEEEIEEVSVES
ncbi:MAG: hypothetical protein ACOC31_00205 [Bacteroidota bacterium]